MLMPQNEFGDDVPPNVEEAARQYACLGGTRYIYRDGEYAGRRPVASVGCRRATRFGSSNYERHKIQLCDGWVAFRSPSYNGALESTEFPAKDRELFDATLDAVLRLTDPRGYSPSDDSWLQEAIQMTERSIDVLVREFVEAPYLHRVEHSLHMRLWDLLRSQSGHFAGTFHLGDHLAVTQLVHKEWPETFARPEKNNRRGNFDIVVLSPKLLAGCQTIEEFREGRLPAPIVVEIGLDYNVHHLAKDARKLINSRPFRGYLVHLTRGVSRDPDVEQIILNLEDRTGIRTAYASVEATASVYKLISADKIEETRRGGPGERLVADNEASVPV
jgi:hypothetical protein